VPETNETGVKKKKKEMGRTKDQQIVRRGRGLTASSSVLFYLYLPYSALNDEGNPEKGKKKNDLLSPSPVLQRKSTASSFGYQPKGNCRRKKGGEKRRTRPLVNLPSRHPETHSYTDLSPPDRCGKDE